MATSHWHPTKQRGTNDTTSVTRLAVELDARGYLEEAVIENLGCV